METDKIILDPTCSVRSIWFDKHEPHTLYCDQRDVDRTLMWKWSEGDKQQVRYYEVKPDVVCDFTALPFDDETFWHVVFDPPHLINLGASSYLIKKYGRLEKEKWRQTLHDGFAECWRVLKTHGTLIFKWNERDIPVKTVIETIGHQPLYGHHSGKQSQTHWLAFMKF